MSEEESMLTTDIEIKLIRCRGLHGTKNQHHHLTISTKVEFGTSLLAESPKVEVNSEDGYFYLDFASTMSVPLDDSSMLDKIAQTPVVLTFAEILPKDKKSKEEKTNVLGQTCVDLLPLLRGETSFSLTKQIHSTAHSAAATTTEANEVSPPEVELHVSTEKPLLTDEQLQNWRDKTKLLQSRAFSNLLTVCVESLYSLPESWNHVGSQYVYSACLGLPVNSEKETTVLLPTGLYRPTGEKEISEKRKWACVPAASSSCYYIPDTEIHHCPYEEEDGELRGKEDVEFRDVAEQEKARVTWNAERRCFLSWPCSEHLQRNIAQYRRWPLEIIRTILPSTGKTKAKEDDSVPSYHGVAYIDLAPLIYPGVSKIRGAYLLHPYDEMVMQNSHDRRTALTSEIIQYIVSNNRSNSSMTKGAGKPTGKSENPSKPKNSFGNIKSDVVSEGDGAINQSLLEGQEYVDARSYILVEIELEKPLVEKRKLSDVMKSVAELIPPRPAFPKKQGGSEKAIKDFETQIGKSANMLLEEFRKMFPLSGLNQKVEDAEERRKAFYYELNTSGKYFALKEQLKYFVIKIVREKFLYTTPFESHEEMQSFLAQLYVFLLDHMHKSLNEYLSTEESAEIPPPIFDSKLLKEFAEEAEKMFQYDVAAKYHQERIARCKNDPESHLDYGIFCLLIDDFEKAEQCFREVVAIQQTHIEGLLLSALMSLRHEEFQRAQELMDAATYICPDQSLPWTILGLYYSGVENSIMAERSFNTATKCKSQRVKLDESTEESSVKKESIFIEATRFLLRCHLTPMSERALAHELTSNTDNKSVIYLVLLAELHIKRAQYEDALKCLEEALVLEHRTPKAWSLKGDVYFILKELKQACVCYERSLAYQNIDAGDLNTVYLRLANAYLQQDMYTKSKDCFLWLCNHAPSCLSWLGTGIACYRMGELKEAEHALNEANINDNHNAQVWAYLTLVSLKNEKYQQSEQCYKYSTKIGLKDERLASELQEVMEQKRGKVHV